MTVRCDVCGVVAKLEKHDGERLCPDCIQCNGHAGDPSMISLERFEAPPSEQVTTFETDELTALCPFDFGGPDHYELTIRYEADDYCLESRSLKQRLKSYRDEEMTVERLADDLFRAIEETIDPARLYVRLEQARRGGIEETVEVGDRALR